MAQDVFNRYRKKMKFSKDLSFVFYWFIKKAYFVFKRLVAYYNAACTTTTCVTASSGRTCNYRMGSQVSITTLQTSPTSRVFTLPFIE